MTNADGDPVYGPLAELVDAWCERKDLGPLSTLLPAYTSNNGLTDGWADLLEALRILRGSHRLPAHEHAEVERLVVVVERIVYRT